MASLQSLKHIKSLRLLKFRQKYGQFVIEGRKSVNELIHSAYEIQGIYATQEHIQGIPAHIEPVVLSTKEYASISQFNTPAGIMAVATIPSVHNITHNQALTLVLDNIADPGNLGTLIRTADWFGIKQIIASPQCADFYNHKTLSATMGSFTRVQFMNTELVPFLKGKNSYGALLTGQTLDQVKVLSPAYLVIGSESHGISDAVRDILSHQVLIPGGGQAESLNASVAGGILMHQFFLQLG